jgi:uncharacterized protein YgiM (DUF1202 family)
MKKILFILALAFLSIQSYSQDAITLANINIREYANSSTKALYKIPKCTEIYIQDCTNGWCKTNYNGVTGFVSSKFIRYKGENRTESSLNNQNYHSKLKYYKNSSGEKVQSPTFYESAPKSATALCWDGTYSFSRNHRGTCSHHGGVKKWLQ